MLELLLKLEMSLWIRETRFNKDYMNRVLHPKFKEFGMSGNTYNKQDIIDSEETELLIKFPFKNVDIQEVNGNFLVTYHVEQIKENKHFISNRSSLWVCEEEVCQLLFHQGTKQN